MNQRNRDRHCTNDSESGDQENSEDSYEKQTQDAIHAWRSTRNRGANPLDIVITFKTNILLPFNNNLLV